VGVGHGGGGWGVGRVAGPAREARGGLWAVLGLGAVVERLAGVLVYRGGFVRRRLGRCMIHYFFFFSTGRIHKEKNFVNIPDVSGSLGLSFEHESMFEHHTSSTSNSIQTHSSSLQILHKCWSRLGVPLTPAPGLHPIDGRDSAVLRDLLERHPVVPLLSVSAVWMSNIGFLVF